MGQDPVVKRGGEELRGVEGGETMIRIHCMRKSTFNKQGKKRRRRGNYDQDMLYEKIYFQ